VIFERVGGGGGQLIAALKQLRRVRVQVKGEPTERAVSV
jgi:hypothetical protein